MKKIVCIVLCLLMTAAVFTGCAKQPKTYEEAASAGKEFMKDSGLKDVKMVTEISGAGVLEGAKIIIDGKYDPKAEKGVFSISLEMDNMSYTLKDEVKIDGRNLYIKIPDMSTLQNLSGAIASAVPSFGEETLGLIEDDPDDMTIGSFDDFSDYETENEAGSLNMLTEILGKYILIKLPEKDQIKTLTAILEDAEQSVYEKAEKLDAEEGYPYVVKYDLKNAYDLVISVLDGVKGKKSDLSKELADLAKLYLGDEVFSSIEENMDGTLSKAISDELDEFFENAEIKDYDEIDKPEKFEVIQKIAYDNNKKFEYVLTAEVKKGDDTYNEKSTVTVTAAEKDADFENRCKVSEEETFDLLSKISEIFTKETAATEDYPMIY